MLSNGNCNSLNLIYFIICIKGNIFYIGETSNILCKRDISDHLDDIINFIPYLKLTQLKKLLIILI